MQLFNALLRKDQPEKRPTVKEYREELRMQALETFYRAYKALELFERLNTLPIDLTLDAQMSWIDMYGRERDVISKRLKSAYLAATKAMEEVH